MNMTTSRLSSKLLSLVLLLIASTTHAFWIPQVNTQRSTHGIKQWTAEVDSAREEKPSKPPQDSSSSWYNNNFSTDETWLDKNRRNTLTGSTAALLSIPFLKEYLPQQALEQLSMPLSSNVGGTTATAVPLSASVLQGDAIVRNLWLGRLTYPVLVVSLEMGLFEALKHGSLSKHDLGQRLTPKLKAEGRVLESIIAVLTSLELLQVHPDTQRVSLTQAARHVLLADSPYFWGPQLLAADGLTGSLRRAVHRDDQGQVTNYASHSTAAVDSFIDSMQAHGAVTAQATATALAPVLGPQAEQPARHVLDMAGGSGCFAQALTSKLGLMVTLADIPSVVARFRRTHKASSSKKMNAVPADLFASQTWPVGPDVHLLANVVHDWGRQQVLDILRASRVALAQSTTTTGSSPARVVLIEQLLHDHGTGPLPAALASVSMLLGDWRTGKQYSYEELRDLLQQAGFARVELGPKCGDFHTAVIAYVE